MVVCFSTVFVVVQNLLRHLKYVEEESQQMCYDDQKLSLSHFKSELDR